MLSISAAEPIFYVFIIFIAYFSSVCLLLAKNTLPKPPYPNFSIISYSPKQLAESKSSPRDAYRIVLFFIYDKSSSKYYAPSELNKRR